LVVGRRFRGFLRLRGGSNRLNRKVFKVKNGVMPLFAIFTKEGVFAINGFVTWS
jgi:hypothetical protein